MFFYIILCLIVAFIVITLSTLISSTNTSEGGKRFHTALAVIMIIVTVSIITVSAIGPARINGRHYINKTTQICELVEKYKNVKNGVDAEKEAYYKRYHELSGEIKRIEDQLNVDAWIYIRSHENPEYDRNSNYFINIESDMLEYEGHNLEPSNSVGEK